MANTRILLANMFKYTDSPSTCSMIMLFKAINLVTDSTQRNVRKRLVVCILFGLSLVSPKLYAADHCVVLQYHHFSDATPQVTSVTPDQFDAHIAYLRENRFNVMPLRDVVSLLENQLALPEKCVSLSVDDAYLSVYTTAYPKIKALGWPMTVFVSTAAVDKRLGGFMSWEQMREMSQHGISFENHGHSHDHLIRKKAHEDAEAWEQRVIEDIQLAQSRITQELTTAPVLFAHPYGEFTPRINEIIKTMGLSGFGQQSGPVWPDAEFGALPRFPMAAGFANFPGFKTKVNSLPMPVASVYPKDPLLPHDVWRPSLTLTFAPGTYVKENIQCFVNGRQDVELVWSTDHPDELQVTTRFDLPVGRSRTNCTMPSNQQGRFHWYSHNWIRREADGGWYHEY